MLQTGRFLARAAVLRRAYPATRPPPPPSPSAACAARAMRPHHRAPARNRPAHTAGGPLSARAPALALGHVALRQGARFRTAASGGDALTTADRVGTLSRKVARPAPRQRQRHHSTYLPCLAGAAEAGTASSDANAVACRSRSTARRPTTCWRSSTKRSWRQSWCATAQPTLRLVATFDHAPP